MHELHANEGEDRESENGEEITKSKSPRYEGFYFWSGRRESNPAFMHPMHVYCRYTTARLR